VGLRSVLLKVVSSLGAVCACTHCRAARGAGAPRRTCVVHILSTSTTLIVVVTVVGIHVPKGKYEKGLDGARQSRQSGDGLVRACACVCKSDICASRINPCPCPCPCVICAPTTTLLLLLVET